MINIAICDDESKYAPIFLLLWKSKVKCEITEYASADKYLSADKEYDLLFLDIEMQDSPSGEADTDKNGMWFAREIRNMNSEKQPVIIFVTGYKE